MGKTIQMDEDDAHAILGLLQTMIGELGTVRQILSTNGHGDMKICGDAFTDQLSLSISHLEVDLASAGGSANPSSA